MPFTDQMKAVMQAIAQERTLRGSKKVSSTRIEQLSGVARQNWLKKEGKPEWKKIKAAIDGSLDDTDEIEQQIATYVQADKTGAFGQKISSLVKENMRLKAELESEHKKFEEFVQKHYNEQYEEIRFSIDYKALQARADNLQKEKEKDAETMQHYQAQNQRLREENREFKRRIGNNLVVGTPKYMLFEPQLKRVSADLKGNELYSAYRQSAAEAFERMRVAMKKRPPDDIFLILHSFNADLRLFINEEVPFKFPDNNYIFACYDPVLQTRRERHEQACEELRLIKPTVIIVRGKGLPQSTNIVELRDPNVAGDIQERLRSVVAAYKDVIYDVVSERYETVHIRSIDPGHGLAQSTDNREFLKALRKAPRGLRE